MRPLAFSSNAFKKNTLEETIQTLGDIGYAAVELMADLHHAYPPTFDPSRRLRTKQILADRRLVVSNINAFTHFVEGDTYHPTWIEDDAHLREKRIAHTLNCIDLAKEFNARTISLQPGGPMIGTKVSREAAAERFAEGLSHCIERAKQNNIILAIEPEPGLFIQTSREYLEFKEQFFRNEDHIQMNCDIGHLFCVGDDPADVIRNLAPHIAHVHVEDIGKNRVHQHLTPGKGVIDFKQIFQALADIRYEGWATVELYPYETTAAGVAKRAWEYLSVTCRM